MVVPTTASKSQTSSVATKRRRKRICISATIGIATLLSTVLIGLFAVYEGSLAALQNDRVLLEGEEAVENYIATVTVKPINHEPLPISKTPNFYEIISKKKCLPNDEECDKCMKSSGRGDCDKCHKVCGCFCDNLCHTKVQNKVVSKVFEYMAPSMQYKRATSDKSPQAEKLIPRIVHQTWFEPLDKKKFPNFSRFANSWKRKNWDYRFYDDQEVSKFLSIHFPAEVKEAYDALIPKEFKADLFRYCVLFIHGGVYADVDVLLESNLDMIIDEDVGFMVPVDSDPGKKINRTPCLWNGLLAAAPGHPFLGAVIETVVNNARNKFTSVDIMQSMCPNVNLHVARKWDLLHTSGPCILGMAVNRFLGRHPQAAFETNSKEYSNEKIPGRVVILKSNKKDMGSHRFTLIEKNQIVAATDMPDSDDRKISLGYTKENHYSITRNKGEVYGASGLYADKNIANEMIRFKATPREVIVNVQ